MGPQGQTPDWLCPLIEDVHKTPGIRMTDQDLRDRALCPNRVRRWFQKHHGMTFQAYLRTLRIGDAFGRIRYGDSVSGAAFDTGYESLSGFTHTFKKATGVAPSHSRKKRLVTVTRLTTPLGPMMAGVVDETVCLLEFVDRRMLETQIARLKKRLHAEALPGQSPVFEELNRQLQEYFSGSRTTFTLPLDLPGTEFQQQVWAELLTIPYGATRSYKAQAAAIGRPTATRAVARANGDNRIAIIVPCHRVIGEDGSLTGYGGGLSRKEYLLNLERAHAK